MSTTSLKRRNSRWDDAPVLDKSGQPKAACITQRDIDGIFRPLTRYRYLPVDYIHALSGGSLDYLVNRLNLLCRETQPLCRAPASAARECERQSPPADLRARREGLARHARTRRPARALTRTVEFRARADDLRTDGLVRARHTGDRHAPDHLVRDSAEQEPADATRDAAKPYQIPVTVTIDGAVTATHVAADGEPFGIARSGSGQTVFFFCPGIEADCGTEPIDASDFQRSSLYKKFRPLSRDRSAANLSLAFRVPEPLRPDRHDECRPDGIDDETARQAHARRRVEDDPVQDLSRR